MIIYIESMKNVKHTIDTVKINEIPKKSVEFQLENSVTIYILNNVIIHLYVITH